MTQWLKQSTAYTFRIGPFVDSTDGFTAKTGLTIAQADIQISKAGGAFAQTSASPTTTYDSVGHYQCPLTATDTGTLGPLRVYIYKSTALPVWQDFMVVPANVYDSLITGVNWLPVTGLQADFSISGATLTVNKQDGSTPQFTKTITSQAGAAPIIGLDT